MIPIPGLPILALPLLSIALAQDPAAPTPPAQPASVEPPAGAPSRSAGEAIPTALQVLPKPISWPEIRRVLLLPIADPEVRREYEGRIGALWNQYAEAFARDEGQKFAEVRGVLAAATDPKPPTILVMREIYATALAEIDRLDSQFFATLEKILPADRADAIAALKRLRERNIASIGPAGHFSLSVPMRWNDPMTWLEATQSPIAPAALLAYDLEATRIANLMTPVRRRFEFEILLIARSQQDFVKQLPTKGLALVDAYRGAARASAAMVDGLRSAIPAEEVARVQIARIEDMYFDTPKPERRVGLETFPSDPALQEAWLTEYGKLAIADAEILRRYEDLALKALAATPLYDRTAYDGRVFLAKSFKDERTRLHDETAAKLAVIAGKQ